MYAWFNHALDRQAVEAKKLENAHHQVTNLMNHLKKSREEALEEKRFWEEPVQDLAQMKRAREDAETEVARLKGVEADLLSRSNIVYKLKQPKRRNSMRSCLT